MKVMNPSKKSDYTIEKFVCGHFDTIEELKEILHKLYSVKLPSVDMQVGYILPGHGLRGKQEWLCKDSDLDDMYAHYKGKKEMLLWCFPKAATAVQSRKRGRTSSPTVLKSSRTSAYACQEEKLTEVQEILKKLQDKHKSEYSAEQLHTWANLIQMKKHESFDNPPNYPFFRGYKRQAQDKASPSSFGSQTPAAISPGRRLNMRSELIDQLGKCVNLFEKGALSHDEYQDMQKTIVTEIKTVSHQTQ